MDAYGFRMDRSRIEVATAEQLANIITEQQLDPNKDLELIDMRVDDNDTTWPTAGEAMRSYGARIGDMDTRIDNIESGLVQSITNPEIDELAEDHLHM